MQTVLTRTHIFALCAAVLLLSTAAASQQVPKGCPERPEDEESALALASTWFKKAEKAYGEKQFSAAVSSFRCSLSMVEHPATYYNAAQAALLAEDKASALEFFRRNLELAPDGKSAAEVELEIARLEKELGEEQKPAPQPEPAAEPGPIPAPEPEQPPEPEPKPMPEDGPNGAKIAGIVLVGIGAAGLVTGAVFQGLAGKAQTESEEAKWLVDFRDAEDRMNTFQKGAYVGFIAGGALLATGVIIFAVSGDDEDQGGADVALVPAPSGLMLSGRF